MSYFLINKIDAIDSTNSALKRLYHQDSLVHGQGLWALDQTEGKGQREGRWFSQPNTNLTFSFFLNHSNLKISHPFHLNCLIALAIYRTMNHFKIPKIKIKWPNDILSDNKKISGILIENLYRGSRLNGSIVGIGINVNQEDFVSLPQASSMRLNSGRKFKLAEVLDVLLSDLADNFSNDLSFENAHKAFNDCLYGQSSSFVFEKNDRQFSAIIRGVNRDGLLVLEENGMQTQHAFKSIKMLY